MKKNKKILCYFLITLMGFSLNNSTNNVSAFTKTKLNNNEISKENNYRLKSYHMGSPDATSGAMEGDIKTFISIGLKDGKSSYSKYKLIKNEGDDLGKWLLVENSFVIKSNTDKIIAQGKEIYYNDLESCEKSINPYVDYSCVSGVKSYEETKFNINGIVVSNVKYDTNSTSSKDYNSLNEKSYNANGKLVKHVLRLKSNSGLYVSGGFNKEYNNNSQLTKSIYFDSKLKMQSYETKSYYKNKKLSVQYYLKYSNNKTISKVKNVFRPNGIKYSHKKATFKSGKITGLYEYKYNTKGQLKSNKYGNSYRTYFGVNSSNKVYKVYRAKYNSKGKLLKSVKVKKFSKKLVF